MGEEWKKLDAKKKEKYEKMAQEEKSKYEIEKKNFESKSGGTKRAKPEGKKEDKNNKGTKK